MESVSQKQLIGTFYLGEKSDGRPRHFLPIAECVQLARQGVGRFINRKTAFQRWDISAPEDDRKTYRSSGRRGESLKIDEPMMIRYVAGEEYAVAAVEAWA